MGRGWQFLSIGAPRKEGYLLHCCRISTAARRQKAQRAEAAHSPGASPSVTFMARPLCLHIQIQQLLSAPCALLARCLCLAAVVYVTPLPFPSHPTPCADIGGSKERIQQMLVAPFPSFPVVTLGGPLPLPPL